MKLIKNFLYKIQEGVDLYMAPKTKAKAKKTAARKPAAKKAKAPAKRKVAAKKAAPAKRKVAAKKRK